MYPAPYKRPGRQTYYFNYSFQNKRRLKNTGCKKLRDAKKFIRDFIDNLQPGSEQRYSEYAKPFLSWETSPKVRRYLIEGKTIGKEHVAAQAAQLQKYVLTDNIAEKPISQITRGDVIDFRERLFQKLATTPNAANKSFIAFKVVLSEAAHRGDIPNNPTAGVGRIKYQIKQQEIMKKQEIVALFSEAWDHLLSYQVFRLAAFTGMRASEVLAIHWDQIQGDILTIDRAWKTRTELGPPKSGKPRVIPLAPSVLNNLPERKKTGLVFCYPDGQRLGKTWWKKRWNAKNTGVKPHSLRHALNTYLIEAGVPLQYIQEYLGWSRTGLTAVQQGYTHIGPDMLRTVSQAIDKLYVKKENVILMKKKA